ncbi:MAG: AAA family ATPase [Nocardioidaceae bacterium]
MAGTEAGDRPATLVVVTGVPGAGKTTLGSAVARALGAPLLSLDTLKERLYASSPADLDPHELRLAAEAELVDELAAGAGTVVVDIWVAPQRDTDRVVGLLRRQPRSVVELLCRVPAEIAVRRYAERQRSGPHRRADRATLQRIREAAARMEPMPIGRCIEVDTSRPVDLDSLIDLLSL